MEFPPNPMDQFPADHPMKQMFDEMMERPMHYVLDAEHNVIPLPRDRSGGHADTLMWAQQFENRDQRRVAETLVRRWWGTVWVSTVFLGLDHSFGMAGPPIVFETMAFPVWPLFGLGPTGRSWEPDGDYSTSDRYSTWDDAMVGHRAIVWFVRNYRGSLREAWT